MVRALALACVLVAAPTLARASDDGAPHAAVHVSVFHPVSTNSNPDVSANFALSIFHSRVGSLKGLGLHPIVSEIGHDAGGLLFTGIYSRVGGNTGGFHVSGLIGSVGGDTRGLQLAGLGNFNDGNVRGLQAGGLFNRNGGAMSGLQFAGFFNTNDGPTSFLQVTSVGNVSDGPMHGLQIAGGLNATMAEMHGIQVAFGNVALDVAGAQLGLFNCGREVDGLQLGAVNLAKEQDGIPIGVLNLAKDNGRADLVVFGSTLSAANVGLRTIANGWSSMLTFGGPDLEGTASTAGFATWNYGREFLIGDTFGLTTDVGYTHIFPAKTTETDDNDRLHFALMARALVEVRPSEKLTLFAGPGVARIYPAYSLGDDADDQFLGTAGFAVRP